MAEGVERHTEEAASVGTPGRSLRALIDWGSSDPIPADAEGGVATKLSGLIRLRWLAVAGQLLAMIAAVRLGWLLPAHVPWFVLTVIALALFNVQAWRQLNRSETQDANLILLHLGLDLAALSVFLLLSGGAWNPLAPIVFIHASLGGLLLSGWRNIALVAMIVAVTAAISVFPVHPPALPAAPTSRAVMLSSMVLVGVMIWGFTTWLARGLAKQRRLLTNLQEQQTRLDRLRAAGALAAGFCHEFATPLNTIRMRLERLGRADEDDNPDLEAALEAAHGCEDVLDRMLQRQLEPGQLRMERTRLAKLLQRICESWAIGDRRVEVHSDIETEARCTIPTLPFAQSMLNLLDNSAEAMQDLGVNAPPVEVGIHRRDPFYVVAVMDRGPGWADVVRANLGQPFLTTKPSGTGLGLYNAHALALALGGKLELVDRPGGGAIAELWVPNDTVTEDRS